MHRNQLASFLLTGALALVFAAFEIDKFINPILWIGFIPQGFEGLFGLSRTAWLPIIGVSEIILALLLLIPVRRVRQVGAILITLQLLVIITQVGWNDIGIRDFALLLSSIALFVLL